MKPDVDMPEFDRGTPPPPGGALRVYGDAMDDFPVLKAFQQYIDAEQAKARKRLLSLGIFFGILTGAIIAVFVVLLMLMTSRNQQLNDRLVEYAMKDRDRQSPVVVQPSQDNAAVAALTAKLDALQKKLDESQAKAEKDAAVAAERARISALEAATKKGPSAEELEIKRLNALLAAEREKAQEQARLEKERAAAEKERKRQEELEAYRRKHYPELYGLPKTLPSQHRLAPSARTQKLAERADDFDDEDDLPDDNSAINYFDDLDDDTPSSSTVKSPSRSRKSPSRPKPKAQAPETSSQPQAAAPAAKVEEQKPAEPPYEIPVEVKGKSSSFRIPL